MASCGDVGEVPRMDDPRWRAFIARLLEAVRCARRLRMEAVGMDQDELEHVAAVEDFLIRLGGIQDLTDDSTTPKDLYLVNKFWRLMEMLIATGFDPLRDRPSSVEEKLRESADLLNRMMIAFHTSMPKATAKSKEAPTPPEEKGCKGQESRSAEHAERPSASAASITDVVIPSSSGRSSDVVEVVPEAPQIDNPRCRAFIARFLEGVPHVKIVCMEELCRSMKRYGLDELCRSMKQYGLDDETMEYMLDLTDDSLAPKDFFFVDTFLDWMEMIIATGFDPLRDRPSSVEGIHVSHNPRLKIVEGQFIDLTTLLCSGYVEFNDKKL